MTERTHNLVWAPFLIVLPIAAFLIIKWMIDGPSACVVDDVKGAGPAIKAIASLEKTIELQMTWAVALIGGGAALLIGFQKDVHLSFFPKASLLAAIAVFATSMLLSVLWRMKLTHALLNDCPTFVVRKPVPDIYDASIIVFCVGLGLVFATVILAAMERRDDSQTPTTGV